MSFGHESLPTANRQGVEIPICPRAISLRPAQLYQTLELQLDCPSIRVLSLDPPQASSNGALSGTLQVVYLKDRPKFAALSYVWGQNVDSSYTISCNNCILDITPNCHQALTSLRQLYGSITIWVDAICINQSDDIEKASQVDLMAEIYTLARPTYIWLGSGCEETDRAVECLKLAATQRLPPPAVPWLCDGEANRPLLGMLAFSWNISKYYLRCFLRLDRKAKQTLLADFSYEDLAKFLDSDWLTRAWTFQEAVLACDPVVLRGSKAISWAPFHQALDFISTLRPSYGSWLSFSVRFRAPPDSPPVAGFLPWRELYRLWHLSPRPTQWCSGRPTSVRELNMQSASDYYVNRIRPLTASAIAGFIILFILNFIPVGLILFLGILSRFTSSYELSTFSIATIGVLSMESTVWLAYFVLYAKIYLWSGENSLPVFLSMVRPLYNCFRYLARSYNWFALYKSLPKLELLFDTRRPSASDLSTSVMMVIRSLRERHAKYPADRAFATFGILGRLGVNVGRASYQEPLGSIYQRLFTSLLHENPRLINLLVVGGSGSLDAPSWVPDWSSLKETAWIHDSFVLDYIQNRSTDISAFTVKDRRLEIEVSWQGSVMFCSGKLPAFESDSYDDGISISLIKSTLTFHEWLKNIRENCIVLRPYDDIPSAIFAALFSERGIFQRPRPQVTSEEVKLFEQWLLIMLRDFPPIVQTYEESRIQDAVTEFLTQHAGVKKFIVECCRRLGGHRQLFFSREAGPGCGPSRVAVGDRIAKVKGVSAPLLLRTLDAEADEYQLIGSSCVGHLMDNRANRSLGGRTIPWEVLYETGENTGEFYIVDTLTGSVIDLATNLYGIDGDTGGRIIPLKTLQETGENSREYRLLERSDLKFKMHKYNLYKFEGVDGEDSGGPHRLTREPIEDGCAPVTITLV